MGVYVDPAGRHQQAGGVDLAPTGTLPAAHRGDALARDRHVPGERRLAVPSMMVPPRMTMSCMERSSGLRAVK
jgi:hypothetical protein